MKGCRALRGIGVQADERLAPVVFGYAADLEPPANSYRTAAALQRFGRAGVERMQVRDAGRQVIGEALVLVAEDYGDRRDDERPRRVMALDQIPGELDAVPGERNEPRAGLQPARPDRALVEVGEGEGCDGI